MKNAICSGALAFGLIAGAALAAAPLPATANSIQSDGNFGGTWSPIGPRDNIHVQRYYRHSWPGAYAYYGPPAYYGPAYDDDYDYDSGPAYYGPSVSIGIGTY